MKVKSLLIPIAVAAVCASTLATPMTAIAQSTTVNGSGATFPQPLYENWAFAYTNEVDKDLKINYGGGGSGKGKTDILNSTVEFAGTDAPLSDAEAAKKPLIQFPSVAGAVVAAFNVPGVRSLVLDGDTLGKIYAGTIAKWNDPAIARLNPGVSLPNLPILVVHRSDGSGTTSIFTTYLTKVSKDWTGAVNPSKGTTVDWPVDKLKRGLGAQGNQGMAAQVQKARGSIGYVELAFAVNNKITYADMLNAAGNQVKASPAATTAAMQDAKFDKRLAADIQNSADPAAWPIAGFTYFLVPKDSADCAKAQKIRSWMVWSITSDEGKKMAAEGLYATLPPEIVPQIGEVVKTMTCNGGNPVK